ncbi:hypothetical protein [Streptomyces viridosporus]|uniref:hypothetical protein n=1 Tax=Streptomyces viridosporus TaxID=67581 RepID=UPI0036FDEEF2
MLFGIDRAVLFLADALSRVVACIGPLFMRSDLRNQRTTPPESLWRATGAGLRWVWRHSLIQVPPPLHARTAIVGVNWIRAALLPLFAFASSPLLIGALGSGYLLTAVGPVGSVFVPAAVMSVTAVIATISPAVRHAPPHPHRTDDERTAA